MATPELVFDSALWPAQATSCTSSPTAWPSSPSSISSESSAGRSHPRRTKRGNKKTPLNCQSLKLARPEGCPLKGRNVRPRPARTLKLRRDQVPCLGVLDGFRLLASERELLLNMFDDAQIAGIEGLSGCQENTPISQRVQATSDESSQGSFNEILGVYPGLDSDGDHIVESCQLSTQSLTLADVELSSYDGDSGSAEWWK